MDDAVDAPSAQKGANASAYHNNKIIYGQGFGPESIPTNTITPGDPACSEPPRGPPELAVKIWDDNAPSARHKGIQRRDSYSDGYGGDSGNGNDNSNDDPLPELSEFEGSTPYGAGGPEPQKKRKYEDTSSEGEIEISRVSEKPRKSPTKIPKSELRRSMLIGTEVKRKRNKDAPRAKVAKPKSQKKKRTIVSKKIARLKLANINSLGSTSAFLDAIANSGRAVQPGFTETRKTAALKELLASIPEEYKVVSRIDKKNLENASKIFGHGRVKADGNGSWLMKATMISNPPPPNSHCKTTLIVATPALVTQWISEIEKHGEKDIFEIVVRYHAGSRIVNAKLLRLTTYNEVASSYPKYDPPESLESEIDKEAWWEQKFNNEKGLLHSMEFYRVILDEAHAIKNHMSRTSIACRALIGKRRWAISGTPILNNVEELYPYFSFLRVNETSSFTDFKRKFCQLDSPVANDKLQTALRQFMIRRMREDSLFGAPLIQLPSNSESTIVVNFNGVERAVYDAFRWKYIKTINGYILLGTLDQMYSNVLTMLLRLRQLTAHIFLVQEQIAKVLTVRDLDKIAESLAPEDRSDDIQIKTLKQLRNLVSQDRSTIYHSYHSAATDDTGALENDGNGDNLVQRFVIFLRRLKASKKWSELKFRKLCQLCHGVPEDAVVLDCMHAYCKECLNSLCERAAHKGHGQTACQACGLVFNSSSSCEGIPELSGDSEPGSRARHKTAINNKDNLEFVDLHSGILPSAKTLGIISQVSDWKKESPAEKIIIFTQFKMMCVLISFPKGSRFLTIASLTKLKNQRMAILARICEREGWGYCEYNGGMSHESRTRSLAEFEYTIEKTVLIASLKCGGVGLNLTMASRVICVDLWWNECIEQQAFCRVIRLGQKKETHIRRITVADTIDQGLLAMQARKKVQISAVLGDDNPNGRLTTTELVSLFGRMVEGDDGKFFIINDQRE
ncbi:hypothetical protein FGG08_002896 [Glutinoglossum americanum]|uniref:Uncharacterized protein n=1 Tax=Glutinoglossum americanum TaxID=1670608 RepID=A0A9P8I3T0_9PEZI|nr:hypothetical protein FGG08_002896 [Glutinoglossum americanum]